jgi:alpha-galactosidase
MSTAVDSSSIDVAITAYQHAADAAHAPLRRAVRLCSATTVLEEALEHGRWIGLYWSASGQVQREQTAAELPGLDALALPLHTFELGIDGQSLHNRWEWGDAMQRPGPRPGTVESVVELRHQVRPITVRVVTRLDGTPFLARYLEIVNTGSAPAALHHVAPWSGLLWNTGAVPCSVNPALTANPSALTHTAYRVGYFAGHHWGEEGDFRWHAVNEETFRIEQAGTGRGFGAPYVIVDNGVNGQRFMLALAWSGNWRADVSLRNQSALAVRLAPLAPAPLRVLSPGEMVTSPEVHLGLWHGTLDSAVAAWHAHIRTSVNPPRPPGKAMYTVAGRVVEEPGEWIHREIDLAADVGVEAFMVDAGWYGETFSKWWELRGDWHEGDWLPGGLAGIRDYCHGKGLLFGLWHEAEALTHTSRTGAEHPEWFLTTDDDRACGETLNLAHPEAARFFEETVLRLVRDYRLDFYKLDYNVDAREGGQMLCDGFAESEFWRHHEVLYRTYDRVRREYPDICLEGCASGGSRNDIGMLARFHYLCESDWSVHPYAIRALNALTLFIPPEALCYYHNHVNWGSQMQAHQMADADTHLRVSLFALPIFVGFGAQNADHDAEFFRKTRRYVELHTGFCRPVLAGHPTVYHHTPDIGLSMPAPWCVLEYAARDRSRGYAGVFKLAHDNEPYRLRLRGVDCAADYDVTLDNATQTWRMPGHTLAQEGLHIELDAALTSELVLYQRIDT